MIEGIETAEQFIAYAARVSNPKNQLNHETAPKLLAYCIKHNHWSIFEMVNVVMEINTTRDIARQILRHRSFSFQELSQRYTNPTDDLGFVWRNARLQDHKNRQNSIETDDKALNDEWISYQEKTIKTAQRAYDWAIENGIAKEQARVVLPEGLIKTRMYMNGTLRSWITYCLLRMENGTQKEHSDIARLAWELLLNDFPFLKNMEKNG